MPKESWVDKRKDVIHLDNDIEKFFIKFLRFCRKHYEFWIGFFVCAIIFLFAIK